MKKVTAIILACLFALSMTAACAGTDNTGSSGSAGSGGSSGNGFNTDRVIAVFTREDGSGTRDAFVNITGVGDDMYIEAVVQNGTSQILTSVETNETGIGYVSVGSLSTAVKALTINGVMPSNETIMNGTYSLQRPFLVVVNDDMKDDPLVSDFIDFMLSIEGQELSSARQTPSVNNPSAYSPGGLSGTIKIGGSTSMDDLMNSIREAYIAHNPGVEIEISGGGSGTGIQEATTGILHIGMSSRALRDNEKEALTDIAIALDGVAVIVNMGNPISGLDLDQVKEIFVGDITRWNQLS